MGSSMLTDRGRTVPFFPATVLDCSVRPSVQRQSTYSFPLLLRRAWSCRGPWPPGSIKSGAAFLRLAAGLPRPRRLPTHRGPIREASAPFGRSGPDQILAAPAPQIQQKKKQPRFALTGSILDGERVAAAIRSSMADITRPFPAVSPPQADSSDSDGSSSSGDEMINCWYTSIHLLDAVGARLIVPGFIQQLQDIIRGLPEADALESLRSVFRDAKKSDAFCYRLSDAIESQCISYADPEGLTGRATRTLVTTTNITAQLLHLIWLELDGKNLQLCQEVKKEGFRQIVGQSLEKLFDAALSLSNARWSGDHPFQMLTILDALVDALYSTRDLPFR